MTDTQSDVSKCATSLCFLDNIVFIKDQQLDKNTLKVKQNVHFETSFLCQMQVPEALLGSQKKQQKLDLTTSLELSVERIIIHIKR